MLFYYSKRETLPRLLLKNQEEGRNLLQYTMYISDKEMLVPIKNPMIQFRLRADVKNFITYLAEIKGVSSTQLVIDAIFDEINRDYLINTWNSYCDCYKEENVTRKRIANSEGKWITLFYSESFQNDLRELSKEKENIILNWLEATIKNSTTVYRCGEQLSNNPEEWQYVLGDIRVFAKINKYKNKVVMLGLFNKSKVELARESMSFQEVIRYGIISMEQIAE